MRTINVDDAKLDLAAAINLARQEPILLVTAEGHEFLLAEADDFEDEAETLRKSASFQQFLDERSRSQRRFTLDEIEAEVDEELARLS